MGGANIIPGVSGGTVALILGIYTRLVTAISRFDLTFINHLRRRRWLDAAQHVDLRFLVALGCGILLGTVGLARTMHYLLEHHRAFTYAAFFGLILASSLLVAKMIRCRSVAGGWVLALLGAVAAGFAFWLVGQDDLQPRSGLLYVFGSGAVAICAMILPGISGAYILVLLGLYDEITELIDKVTSFRAGFSDFATLVVFAGGCGVGLVVFSKLLKLLLTRCYAAMMAVLGGFMVGSLRRVWPFQVDLTPEVAELKHKRFDMVWPETWDGPVVACIAIVLIAVAAVLWLDRIARTRWSPDASDSSNPPASELTAP